MRARPEAAATETEWETIVNTILVVASLLTMSVPVLAHHGNASVENKTVVMKGTVTEWLCRLRSVLLPDGTLMSEDEGVGK